MAILKTSNGFDVLIDDDLPAHILKRTWCAETKTRKHLKTICRIYCHSTQEHLHRLIMNCPPKMCVVYKNGNYLDCRRENLMVIDRKELAIKHTVRKDSRTKIRGVSIVYDNWGNQLYAVRCTHRGVKKWLGRAKTIDEALDKIKTFRASVDADLAKSQ